MRLIDADEFESYLITRYGGNDCADDIIEDLHNQPTFDAVAETVERGRRMSVLIKGMEMPENCIMCPFAERVPPGRTRCLLTYRFLADGYKAPSPERNEFCPLVAQPEPTLNGYPIEHLEMIARVMAKENCTTEAVAQMLQNAGEVAKMVCDEMMEMLKESIERSCKGVANEERTDHRADIRQGRISDRL